MAKNLVVTVTGYAGELKQGKTGAYVVIPVPVRLWALLVFVVQVGVVAALWLKK